MFKKTLLPLVLTLLLDPVCWAGTDVNQASVAELDSIKGIGPALSERILIERKKGGFKDWPDFMARVKGVAPSAAVKLSDQGLNVNGTGFEGAAKGAERTATPALK
ncbi:MAG: helix-hairpin-helix domain-containing protein [Burkholderiaceae bacterium]